MKRILFLITLFLALESCDVLDVKPQSAILADQAFKNKAGIEKGILGGYASFTSLSYYGRTFITFADLAADNLDQPTDGTAIEYREVDNNAILPDNGSVSGIWAICYDGINVANNVIAQVPNMTDMSPAEKNKALGELYFIRALNHFNLVNYFGAVPLKTTATAGTGALDAPRAPISAVYTQIIDDLLFAEDNLPASAVKARASKYAAAALLARVYLYKGDYALAKAKATDVITKGGYQLLPYADIFKDNANESIFEIDFTTLVRNRIAEYNFPKTLNGRREVAPANSLMAAYETGDLRKNASTKLTDAPANLPYSVKYDDIALGADNVIVLRLAEMYLIRAEAEAKLEGVVLDIQTDINTVRTRAGLNGTTATAYADLLLTIERERRVEFAFEGHRWFDLVRTSRALSVLDKVNNLNQTLFPIPLSEIQTNQNPDMKQNPGY